MQSDAFSEPVFQRHGKLVTFFRGFVLPRTLIGKSRRKKVFQIDLAEHLFSVGINGIQPKKKFIELQSEWSTGFPYLKILMAGEPF